MRAFRDLRVADPAIKADATAFLTAANPEQAHALETWCAYALLDPNTVVSRTQEYLTKGAFVAC